MSYAHVLKTLGRQAEALREYRAAIALKPDFGEVYWSMANLKVFRFEPEEVAAMEGAAEARGPERERGRPFPLRPRQGLRGRRRLRPRLGVLSHAATSGSGRWCPTTRWDSRSRHEEIAEVFSREFLEQHAGEGFESDAPIFIVGLPRSGSTLIEQILASHSQVEGTLELPTLGEIAVSTGRYRRDSREYPDAVRELRGRDFRAYGQQYIEETRDLPLDRTGRASPTSCRTTSRTSASRT